MKEMNMLFIFEVTSRIFYSIMWYNLAYLILRNFLSFSMARIDIENYAI